MKKEIFCENCGTKISFELPNAPRFCMSCGAKLNIPLDDKAEDFFVEGDDSMSKITLNPKNISKETVILNVIKKNKKINEDTKSILRAAFTTIELSEDLWCGVKNVRISGNFEAVKQAALQFVDTMENACKTNDLVFFYIQHGGELLHRDDYFEMARHQIEENSFRIENKDPELMGYFVMNREELNRKKEQEKNNKQR